ncbi:hypothetical protein K435DRAFT_761697 [Dendrothele bispora CBS 962.96]|uniref:Mitochondrial import inner membrane translocase subunit TIM54 n=1 Tax=Dendrothele bispora (strain CBS 962.96) TaxID=1314807 RepID=A0A4S8LI90_DENBC|nr:hypothetical protein K435DRAFT_761697 [Dendrothele bispora CBS 962.96]
MSTQDAKSSVTRQKSGIRAALEYTGIPPSWLDKRPRLPSRNWLIFLSVTSSITGLYIYDRRQCKRIKQEYIEKVKYLSEQTADHLSWPRKVTVYGAKWPGDEDYDQAIKYFRKYVKPVLVAGAVDYEMIVGKRSGDLTRRVADEVKTRRRVDVGLDPAPSQELLPPGYPFRPLSEVRQKELEGGIVIVGRPTWKEFMAGLKRGWTESIEKFDEDERLAQELEMDGRFDEPEEPLEVGESFAETNKDSSSPLTSSPVLSHLQYRLPPPSPQSKPPAPSSIPESLNTPPAAVPVLPPILFVTFTNYIGFKQIPLMIWDFFNQRHKVLSGAEAGYRLVMSCLRPFNGPPEAAAQPLFADITSTSASSPSGPKNDLDFDKETESYYRSSLFSIPKDIEKARKKYYEELPAKLAVARELARGTREPTKQEIENPPSTEVELRADRMKKEKRWRADLEGWNIVRPDKEVEWDERFRDALRVFDDPPDTDLPTVSAT